MPPSATTTAATANPALARLEAALSSALTSRAQRSRLRTLTLPATATVDFSSNDYLSLARSALFRTTLQGELAAHPTHPLGSGGSRLLDGNSPYAAAIEAAVAAHHAHPSAAAGALLFNSGFDANAGFFAAVPQPADIVVYDELVHASVWEGMRAGRAAAVRPFAHNDVRDLVRVLRDVQRSWEGAPEGIRGCVFVAVESVYSMDGDLAPLQQLLDAADEVLPGGALFVVDEAHATGVVGAGGRGLVSALGLEERVLARLVTFGKALACNGGMGLSPSAVALQQR